MKKICLWFFTHQKSRQSTVRKEKMCEFFFGILNIMPKNGTQSFDALCLADDHINAVYNIFYYFWTHFFSKNRLIPFFKLINNEVELII